MRACMQWAVDQAQWHSIQRAAPVKVTHTQHRKAHNLCCCCCCHCLWPTLSAIARKSFMAACHHQAPARSLCCCWCLHRRCCLLVKSTHLIQWLRLAACSGAELAHAPPCLGTPASASALCLVVLLLCRQRSSSLGTGRRECSQTGGCTAAPPCK